MPLLNIKWIYNNSIYFIPSTHAVSNCDENSLYSDKYNWLTIFNKNLEFNFEPIKFGNYPSTLLVSPLKINANFFLTALNIYSGNKNFPCSIGLYDFNGKNKERICIFKKWHSAILISNKKILKPI